MPDAQRWHHVGVGTIALRRLDLDRDTTTLHRWVTHPRSQFWGMTAASPEELRRCYEKQIDSPHSAPYLGLLDGAPRFLVETYDPAHDVLASHYPVQDGDVGMHFLIAPPTGALIHGLSRAVIFTILGFLFSSPGKQRVVVEPDVRNDKIHPLNRAAGFRYAKQILLPHKTAWLAFCTRPDFLHAQRSLEVIS